ncbi:hypothetical protein KTO58_19255 [Chitinophaga pendula]|uniref:hypothetical protein n=1 Tax=Chitinophaga TaxID=79328 RepID=UPI000BAEA7CA|nr:MULTISPECIES: hypothetical protein [Chitinophaga]ASZ11190.1 hypothetical protein CK934_09555 [Chitinophaga sp. MD30]UCJ05813.1 hypothetical protein KTO58_19255 [Chitinophaga pendula]
MMKCSKWHIFRSVTQNNILNLATLKTMIELIKDDYQRIFDTILSRTSFCFKSSSDELKIKDDHASNMGFMTPVPSAETILVAEQLTPLVLQSTEQALLLAQSHNGKIKFAREEGELLWTVFVEFK